ncbi:MAG: permease, partial [Planctomycetota bacterium]|nr:permease [Planctomycetota bacterium]
MPEWLADIPVGFWDVLSEMSPYLLFGFLMAGVLSVFVSPAMVERHLGGKGIVSVVKAAAFGVPLPLCSCGVIPVSASLRRHGAGKGATTSFLIATPQDGVDSIMVTYGLLGGVYAIFRPIVALVTGIAGGAIVNIADGNSTSGDVSADAHKDYFTRNGHGRIRRIFTYGFDTLPKDIGRALLVGLVLAALISAVVPKDYFSGIFPPGILQILVLMLAGIPVYVCATASVPLVYALIVAGVSPGAAFAFLMTGPATNAATITTIWKVMGRRTTIIYLSVMIAGALG